MGTKHKKRKLLPIILGYLVAGVIIVGVAFKMLFRKLSFSHQEVEYGKNSNR